MLQCVVGGFAWALAVPVFGRQAAPLYPKGVIGMTERIVPTWADKDGARWEVVHPDNKLQFSGPATRALRAFIHKRANFTCQHCDVSIDDPPIDYDGSHAFHWMRPVGNPPRVQAYIINNVTHLLDGLIVDHIIPWRDGGTHHPDNLQLLCSKCHKRKARWEAIWRENGGIGTPNDYVGWVKKWVPPTHGGVLDA